MTRAAFSVVGRLPWTRLVALALTACIPPAPAARPPPVACEASPAPAPDRRADPRPLARAETPAASCRIPRRARVGFTDDTDLASTIGTVRPMGFESYRVDSYSSTFISTEDGVDEDCMAKVIDLDTSGGALADWGKALVGKGKAVVGKGKALVDRGKSKLGTGTGAGPAGADDGEPEAGEAPADEDEPEDKAKAIRNLLGYPITDPDGAEAYELLQGRRKPWGLAEDDCPCSMGALQSEVAMCKAQVYRLEKPHRVWQPQEVAADGKTPMYPFDKLWNPRPMPFPVPEPLPGDAYFQCDIPRGTYVAIGIGEKPLDASAFPGPSLLEQARSFVVKQAVAKAREGAAKLRARKARSDRRRSSGADRDNAVEPVADGPQSRPADGAPASQPTDGAPASQPVDGADAEGELEVPPPEWITLWYLKDSSGTWSSSPRTAPPREWACKRVELICLPGAGCTPKPDLNDLKKAVPGLGGGGMPAIPGMPGM